MSSALDRFHAAAARRQAPLDRDTALAALTRAKRQMRRRAQAIRRLHAGAMAPDEIETLLLRRVYAGFATLDAGGRDALLRLLLHVDAVAPEVLSTAWGCDRFGPMPGNALVDGLVGLARQHEHWRQAPRAWRPRARHERERFAELACHLLARYPVPAFLHTAWFAGDEAEARQQQGWFVHLGAGHNLRTAEHLPLALTKRMAHEVLSAPADVTVTQGLRWGQVRGGGGSPELAAMVNRTRLGRGFEGEDFWSTVIAWLARNEAALPLDWVPSIVAYLHHRRHEPENLVAPDGSLTLGPPAEPHLSMKSRSVPKLLRHVERWRAAWTVEAETPTAFDDTASRLGHLYLETEDDRTGKLLVWTIQQLRSARSMANEGHAMSHCLSSKVVDHSNTTVWSLQVRDGDRTRRVMTVSVNMVTRSVQQARGRFNANPDREVEAAAVNPGDDAGMRLQGRLSSRERDLLRQSHRILRLWLEREEITY